MSPKLPVKDLKEFVAYAKAHPGKVNVASFGAATISHLAIEFFKVTTGVDVVHVPYRGGAQIMADLISGQIQAAVDSLPSSLPHIKSGAIRGLALLSAERSPVLPDLPVAGEIIPGLEVRTFSGVGVPSGTPREIIERLNKEINAGLANPAIKARFADVGATAVIMTFRRGQCLRAGADREMGQGDQDRRHQGGIVQQENKGGTRWTVVNSCAAPRPSPPARAPAPPSQRSGLRKRARRTGRPT